MKTKKLLLSLLTTWVVVTGLSAKNTIVTFRSNKEITVRVNKPIDGVYNFYYNTDRMDLKPNISIGYELDIHDCCSIRCELSSGLFFYVLLQEGDHLEISNMGNQIIFKGDNAAGNQYLFENYCMKGLGEYFPKVDSIFKKNISNKVDYNAISKTFHQYIVPSYTKDIEALQKEKKITSAFASDMLQNLYFAYSSIYFYHYQKLYSGKFINYKPSVLDSTQIVNEIDRLYSLTQWKVNPLKCYYASMENYYSFKYRSLDQMSKNKLLAGHDKETFGEYAGYLLAPDTLQSALFGSLLISNLQNKETYFDQELMLK
ncbi:MAG: hypothetical protein Q8909_15550, partial [Bacteroidota bacterium]|nr:hypothetical protein [Bacteroidota bacterium]